MPQGRVFECLDGGVNIVEGATLYEDVITENQETEFVEWVLARCAEGRAGKLKKPTFLQAGGARSRGNKRQALQYGGFFDFNKACPGKRGLVPPFPPWLSRLTQQLVAQGYLPKSCIPNTCIINYYSPGDCIPPHVDHASYPRPICTMSLLGEENMLLGSQYATVGPNKFEVRTGVAVPLPRRSLLVMDGNSANVAKHCVSACVGERISLTLRKEPSISSRKKDRRRSKMKAKASDSVESSVPENGGSGNARKKKKSKFRKKLSKLFGDDLEDGESSGRTKGKSTQSSSPRPTSAKRKQPRTGRTQSSSKVSPKKRHSR